MPYSSPWPSTSTDGAYAITSHVPISVWVRWRSRKVYPCSIPNNPSGCWGASHRFRRSTGEGIASNNTAPAYHDARVPLTTAAFSLRLSPWHKRRALSLLPFKPLTPVDSSSAFSIFEGVLCHELVMRRGDKLQG